MKKLTSIAALAALLAVSCRSNTDTAATKPAIPTTDTAGLGQFQQWKAQNELANTPQYNATAPVAAPAPKTRTVVKYVPVRSSNTTTYSSTSSNAAKASTKRGWSKAAKGAVIGGVGGAAAGAIINKKNRGAGAVIGGVLGGAAGYGIGRGKDRKDGRVQ